MVFVVYKNKFKFIQIMQKQENPAVAKKNMLQPIHSLLQY